MNTHKVFSALALLVFLGSITSAPGAQELNRKTSRQGSSYTSTSDTLLKRNTYVQHYVPNDLRGIAGQHTSIPCTKEGQPTSNRSAVNGSCYDYQSSSNGTLWRISYGGTAMSSGIERVFKYTGNTMTLWVVFDVTRGHMSEELYASDGARQQYLASGGGQNDRASEQARGGQNTQPNNGAPNIDLGGALGTILNDIFRKTK